MTTQVYSERGESRNYNSKLPVKQHIYNTENKMKKNRDDTLSLDEITQLYM